MDKQIYQGVVKPINLRPHTSVTRGRYCGAVIIPVNWVKRG